MLTLEIETRDVKKKPKALRKEGLLPAVYYGNKTEATPIAIPLATFLKAWKEAGESTVVTLKSATKTIDALIHDVDFDPVTDLPRHADFYVFDKDHKVEVEVPLEFIGVAPAIKELGGILVKALHELKIEAMPKDLPHEIEIDVSSLVDFDSQILAQDIKLPAGVTLVEDPEEVVASITRPVEEKEEEVPVDLASVEVEKKGKKEEEGGEETPAEAAA